MPQPNIYAPLPLETMPPGVPLHHRQRGGERFCFYGMKTVLIVFMTKFLLDRQNHLAPMGEEEAKFYYHLCRGGVYFSQSSAPSWPTPLWGKYRTIFYRVAGLFAGQLCAGCRSDASRLFVGLLLITLGPGASSRACRPTWATSGARKQAPAGKSLRLVLFLGSTWFVFLHAAGRPYCGPF